MSRCWWIFFAACAGVLATAWFVATPPAAAVSAASQPTQPDLGAILLDDRDVPPGFKLDAKQSGPNEMSPTLPGWLREVLRWLPQSMRDVPNMQSYDRVWFHERDRRAIIAQVIEYPLDALAGNDGASVAQDLKRAAQREFFIATVPHARGFVVKQGHAGATAVHGVFVQGPRAFSITVVSRGGAPDADVELVRRLVQIQASKAPTGPTELVDIGEARQAVGTVLGTLGAAAAYIAGLSLVAWLRDPLRRRSTRLPSQVGMLTHTATVDVTARARRRRRWAAAGLALELCGVGSVLGGLQPFTWPLGLLLVMFGFGVALLPRLVAAAARRAKPQPTLWTGRRRLRVTCYAVASTVCVLAGLLGLVLYGVGTVVNAPVYDYNIRILLVGSVLLAVGTLVHRRARRLAALDAREALRRDPRPIVLYLRAFADDSLTIRTATSARKSFVDQLSPRRFERFEEVLVRHLTAIGPVVAINPPNTDLPPIGAARETLGRDDGNKNGWKPAVARHMTDARLVVVAAAPEVVTPGLEWELGEIDSQRLWSKTLLLLPPVPDMAVRARWQRFAKVFADTAMASHLIPADPARTLALLGFPATGWRAVTADQRTEWSYAEALLAATATAAPRAAVAGAAADA